LSGFAELSRLSSLPATSLHELVVMRSKVRILEPLARLDVRRHFSYCGGVADFAALCRDLPTQVVDLL
jgi:hypothetical protein